MIATAHDDIRTIIRFLAVGALNIFVGYALFFVGLLLLDRPLVALVGATVLGVAFNFLSTGTLVFNNRDPARIIAFVTVYCVMFAINAVLLSGLMATGLSALLAQAILALPVALTTFVLQRRFVFRGPS